ncbi:hypothetical protein N657DRAFT_101993 [Parathielavia appendiculata]|uniref:Uncharacterized protein n=1 Tax=Parathielavia appendiculata TaxID=2587402 RepID=A0AAN6TW85_9PEZI|nr:hypothetical protein N657DRAFT_101993 [Parathielavia appendiculata]
MRTFVRRKPPKSTAVIGHLVCLLCDGKHALEICRFLQLSGYGHGGWLPGLGGALQPGPGEVGPDNAFRGANKSGGMRPNPDVPFEVSMESHAAVTARAVCEVRDSEAMIPWSHFCSM